MNENRRLKEFKDLVEARPENIKLYFNELREKALAT